MVLFVVRGWLVLLGLVGALGLTPARAEPVHLRVLGGLGGVAQYTRHEAPFWTVRLPQLSGGRLTAEIAPFDRSGIRAQEMLALMRLGVVPFGTIPLGAAASEVPEFNAADLPGASPDIQTLRRTADALREPFAALLRERYGVELLALYVYPAQVLFCRQPFTGFGDLSGRRIRTSSVAQTEMVEALGAVGVQTPFNEIVPAVRNGVVDCAITGTLSGNSIGLSDLTSHVHAMAVTWGVTGFGANAEAWEQLPEDLRRIVRDGLATLEREIWAAAERDTEAGLACNAGQPGCEGGRPGRMQVVGRTPADDALRQRVVRDVVVPRWRQRCGPDCDELWDQHLAPVLGAAGAARP